jgi:acyl-CoA thioesterase YciA
MVMELISTRPIKKSDLGFHGNLFGGTLLKYIDSDASGLAMQLCDSPMVVTKSLNDCIFHKPGKEGQLLKIYGKPLLIGTTSLTMYLESRSHSVYTGKQTILLTTNITFVRIDEEGNPIPISERAKNRINQMINGTEVTDRTI